MSGKPYDAAWYAANRDRLVGYQRDARMRTYAKLVAIKLESGCVDCGYNVHAAALQFDHRPDEDKSFDVSSKQGWTATEQEIAKCDVVCANCHAVRTYTRSHQGVTE
jgi:hypothetical protein